MSDIVAVPFGNQLPYYALFTVPKKDARRRRLTKHFLDKPIAPFTSSNVVHDPNPSIEVADFQMRLSLSENIISKSSEIDDQGAVGRLAHGPPVKKKSLARMRYIAFRAFVPRIGNKISGKAASTETIAKQKLCANDPFVNKKSNLSRHLLKSWRIKRKGARDHVQKVTAVAAVRVSSRSPEDQKPTTWEQYNKYYGAGRIDINDPPSPPMEPSEVPTPFQKKLYMPPNADDEQTRQLVINRLGLFGKKGFQSSEEGTRQNQERAEPAEKLEQEGRAPKQEGSFARQVETPNEMNPAVALKMTGGAQFGKLLPESLEQYHVFKKIAKQCCEVFGASASMLSILEADRQLVLAQSGLDGMREVPRGLSICCHTVLNGRRGLSVLDLTRDWRFSSSPLLTAHGARFYAGVPLMAPNLDGSPESEKSATPLGTLCIFDVKPRESFGREERKKLLYMAEYARRQIGLWFKGTIEQKVAALEDSQKTFSVKVQAVMDAREEKREERVEAFTENPKMKVAATPAITHAYAIGQTRMWKKINLRGGGRGDQSSAVPNLSTLPTAGDLNDSAPALVVPRIPSLLDNKRLSINSKIQQVLQLATVMVGSALDVNLVYLITVAPHVGPSLTVQTSVLSEYNPLASVASPHTQLYQRVLSAPEGGLIYQYPSSEQAQDAGLMPTSQAGSSPYISAILVRVGPEASAKTGGVVLAGFTTDDKRVFGAEDYVYMKQFAVELTHHTSQLLLW